MAFEAMGEENLGPIAKDLIKITKKVSQSVTIQAGKKVLGSLGRLLPSGNDEDG